MRRPPVLTSSNQDKDADRAYLLGANSYVVKPTSLEAYQSIAERIRDYWLELNRPPSMVAP
jgi:CheY-like chemotaxis protein